MSKRKLQHLFVALFFYIVASGITAAPVNPISAEFQTVPISLLAETVPVTG